MIQVAVIPFSGTLRVSLLNDNVAFFSNFRSLNATAIDTPHVLKSRNGASYSSKRLFCCYMSSNGYSAKKQSSRMTSMKKLYARKYGAEEAAYAVKEVTDEDLEKQVQPSDVRILAAIRSRFNYITVMEIAREADHLLAGARLLLLDNPGCIHTVYYEHNVLTNSYYDALATIVPILPEGPVGILGLGAGATSHILHHFFPTIEMHGWELDPDIINIARQFFNMSELEGSDSAASGGKSSSSSFVDQVVEDESKRQMSPGMLTVHIGDALGPDVCVAGGFAGLIVDLFAEGRVVPALQQAQIWEQLKSKLRPGGRIIVNCGGDRVTAGEQSKSPGWLYMEETISAMGEVFAGELSTRYLARKGFNTIAITGPAPEVVFWTRCLPEPLRDGITEWKHVS